MELPLFEADIKLIIEKDQDESDDIFTYGGSIPVDAKILLIWREKEYLKITLDNLKNYGMLISDSFCVFYEINDEQIILELRRKS